MTQLLDTPFWLFKPSGDFFDLFFIDANGIESKLSVSLSNPPLTKAQLLSKLDLELAESLESRLDLLIEMKHIVVPHGMTNAQYIMSVVAAVKFSQPNILGSDSDIDFNWDILKDCDCGDTMLLEVDGAEITFFVSGLFGKALQGIVLKSTKPNYKVLESLYIVV